MLFLTVNFLLSGDIFCEQPTYCSSPSRFCSVTPTLVLDRFVLARQTLLIFCNIISHEVVLLFLS